MKTQHGILMAESSMKAPHACQHTVSNRPVLNHFVTSQELEEMRNALGRKHLPADFAEKLARLAQGDLLHRFVAQNCRTFIALLQAAREGAFKGAAPSDCERLLRVLAYVRKDDDEIPDYRPDGFVDDQNEVRAAATELGVLVQSFKSWHLRHQVPSLWRPGTAAANLGLAHVRTKATRVDSAALAAT
jgi:hypothetical protein